MDSKFGSIVLVPVVIVSDRSIYGLAGLRVYR